MNEYSAVLQAQALIDERADGQPVLAALVPERWVCKNQIRQLG
jgi:hypothetical protein